MVEGRALNKISSQSLSKLIESFCVGRRWYLVAGSVIFFGGVVL